ncbi:hypothetical protein [Anaeromicropila herbilytica]|uniref:Uncharacterized protein n=1 Tax=Anaeromicropila herbilytica TaxID=2785025 RepID=A0A7R7ID95_9FIRM|nr:hypothetical protein [Anaeromicropila herbilytica]BCN29798.1 hypothetical protein bsdtb5_10930 [Anaeromicropila herbilytica]
MLRKAKKTHTELEKTDLSMDNRKKEEIPKELEGENIKVDEMVYEIVEREILPEKIICPDCGGVTLQGLDFCDRCGGELNNYYC